jgi:hypothetical protein
MQLETPVAGVVAAEKATTRATWRWSPSTGCRRIAKLERHPSANADTRGGVAESWATTTTTLVLALTLPFALAFVGVGRWGGGWGDPPMGT